MRPFRPKRVADHQAREPDKRILVTRYDRLDTLRLTGREEN